MQNIPPGKLIERITHILSSTVSPDAEASLKLLKGIYEQSHYGYVEFNSLGKIISTNRMFCDITGIPESEAEGTGILDAADHPDFRDHILQLMEHHESTPVSFVIPATGLSCSLTSWSVETSSGTFFHSSLHDITASREIPCMLGKAENSFARVIKYTDSMVYCYREHPEKSIYYINKRCETLTGYRADEFYQDPDLGWKIIHPDDLPGLEEISRDPAISHRVQRARMIKKDGSVIWTEHLLLPVFDDQGNLIAVDGIVRDVNKYLAEEQRSLKAAEDYQRIFNSTQAAMFLIEVNQQGDFRFLRTNRAHQEKTGITLSAIAGKTPEEVLGAELAAQVTKNYQRCIDSGEVVTYEERLHLPKGPRVWLTELTPIFDDSRPAMIIGSATDITARKQYEQARKKTEEWIRGILQGAPVGIGVVQDGVIQEANEQTSAITGLPRRKLLGMQFSSLFGSIPLKTKGTYELEWVPPGKDPIDIIMTTSPINSRRSGRGCIFSILDISERKQAERDLKKSEERFRSLYENATLGMYQSTPGGKVLMANTALLEMLGYESLSQLQQRDLNTEGYGNHELRSKFLESIAESDNLRGYETIWKKRDGTTIFIRESARAVRNEQQEILYFEGTVENITDQRIVESEREQLQQQLFQTQKMESVGRLAGGVAHDFNNMLGVILGYTEMAMDLAGEGSTIQEYLKEILHAAKRSGDLTRQLLTFARKQQVVSTVIDINKVISSMINMMDLLLGEQIDLVFHPEEDTWPVKIDVSQMHQIMTNLLANARDAIDQTGKVNIITKNIELRPLTAAIPPGEYVMISVEDSGKGISKEAMDRLFEPYFTTKDLGKGTGLGLSSVLGIIQQNRGHIEVSSKEGEGTTFYIYLPRSFADNNIQEEQEQSSLVHKAATILLVEDEKSILDLGSKMLKSKGYHVLTAQHPLQAIELAGKHKHEIDLLITDVIMPDLNGKELQERLREMIPHLNTLFISGYSANVISWEDTQHDETSDFLPKPFSMGVLLQKVTRLLSS